MLLEKMSEIYNLKENSVNLGCNPAVKFLLTLMLNMRTPVGFP